MVENVEFVSIREVLARVARHPLMQDIDLEAGVQYTLDFYGIVGLPASYIDKTASIRVEDYRAELPCDLVSINMVRNNKTGQCMRAMTDVFWDRNYPLQSEDAFKIQNHYIYTSFQDGNIDLSYRSIPVDEDNLPMIPGNAVFLKALEDYIKVQRFTLLFDVGKVSADALSHAEQEYAWSVGRCQNRFKMPSISEMQSLTGMMHRLIPAHKEFERGFKTAGDSEHYRRH